MRYPALFLFALLCLGLQSCNDGESSGDFGLLCEGVEGCADGIPMETGLMTFESGGVEREFYVQVPPDHYASNTNAPIVFAMSPL